MLPDWLLATAEQAGFGFDALVVDEAQEFTPAQLEALMLLLPDPDHSPAYLFADPFQHSARFSTHRLDRSTVRGRYNWVPPADMPIVTLRDNVRNSEPISDVVGHFLAEQGSTARVRGREPEILQRATKDVIAAGLERVEQLITKDGFAPNQVLAVFVGWDKEVARRATVKNNLDAVDVSGVLRFPLPTADLRVAYGAPDDVQGLEAEVAVVMYGATTLSMASVRDLYVAASRARSHLVFVGPHTLPQLRTAARVALTSAPDDG